MSFRASRESQDPDKPKVLKVQMGYNPAGSGMHFSRAEVLAILGVVVAVCSIIINFIMGIVGAVILWKNRNRTEPDQEDTPR